MLWAPSHAQPGHVAEASEAGRGFREQGPCLLGNKVKEAHGGICPPAGCHRGEWVRGEGGMHVLVFSYGSS